LIERKGFYNPLQLVKPAKLICMYKKIAFELGAINKINAFHFKTWPTSTTD